MVFPLSFLAIPNIAHSFLSYFVYAIHAGKELIAIILIYGSLIPLHFSRNHYHVSRQTIEKDGPTFH